ncbi:MAG: triple tyrosine motif-containing protein [Salinivirgaceae bacterium]|jgi:PAS domain S-box-containing protein|nr:triple tyrosine motif-containing protein [Salinivirgaceae bacterium]
MIHRHLLLIFLILITHLSFATSSSQIGYPIINNYVSTDLGSSAQVWDIIQDSKNYFYFATNIGVVRFDGISYKHYELPLKSSVRSLVMDNTGIIYVGATDEFGYLKPDKSGKYIYHSLSSELVNKEVGAVLKTIIIGNVVWFLADHHRVFKYDNSKLFEIETADFNNFRSFKLEDKLYFFQKDVGVGIIENNWLKVIDSKALPADLYFALPINNNVFLAGTLNKGLYTYDINKMEWKVFNVLMNEKLKKASLYNAIKLKNGNIALATLKSGIYLIDQKGKILNRFTKDLGLLSNMTFCLYEDVYNDIWAGQETGLSQIEMTLPFRTISNKMGLEGSLRKIIAYEKSMLVATSNGIYKSPLKNSVSNPEIKFENLDQNYIYGLDFCKLTFPGINNKMLISTTLRHLVWITPDFKIKELYSIYGCYTMVESISKPGRVFLGGPSGITIFDFHVNKGNLTITEVNSLPNFNESIRELKQSQNGDLWARTSFNQVFKVVFDKSESINTYKLYKYDELNENYPNLILTGLYEFENKVIVSSNCGLFSIHNSDSLGLFSNFLPDRSFAMNYEIDSNYIQNIAFAENGDFWMNGPDGPASFDISANKLIRKPYKRLSGSIQYMNSVPEIGFCLLGQNTIYIAENRNTHESKIDFCANMNKVIIANNYKNICFDGNVSCVSTLNELIPKDYNTIKFNFSAPYYKEPQKVKYTSKLHGFDNDWNIPSYINTRDYTNLPSGKYMFEVKGINIYDATSHSAKFEFEIEKPWYLKTLTLISFIVIIGLFIWLLMFFYKRKLLNTKKQMSKTISAKFLAELERKNINDDQESEDELNKLIQVISNANSAIVIIDALGEIEWINDGYKKMYGYKLHELLLNGIQVLDNRTESIIKITNYWKINKNPLVEKKQMESKDGQKITVQATYTPIFNDEVLQRIIVVDVNISDTSK